MHLDTRLTLAHLPAYQVRRREPRYASSIPVSLKRFLRYGPVVSRGVSLDISVRGMSALVCGAPRGGETVVIELPLGDAAVEMLATVRHSNDARSEFEFYPLSPIAQQGIREWIEELRKHEEKLFPYPYASAADSGNP